MGPTAGSSGMGLVVGVLEGTLGGLVGARAFLAASDRDVVGGGWVNHASILSCATFKSITIRKMHCVNVQN